MDTIQNIDSQLRALQDFKQKISSEIDSLQKEFYEVKADSLGLNEKLKAVMSRIVSLSHGATGILAEIYHHAVDEEVESAQEYLDRIKQTQSKLRDLISKVDQTIANLEKCKNDLHYKLDETNSWLNKSKELLG